MLKEEVRDAVATGRFHIFPVHHHRRGHRASSPAPRRASWTSEGLYPEGTVNRLVTDRLVELSEKARELFPRSFEGEHRRGTPAPAQGGPSHAALAAD